MEMDRSLKLIVEALLFASDRPLSAREIKTWLSDETPSDIRQALTELQAEYDATERSFVLKEVGQGYQFRTKSEYGPYVLRMLKTSPTRLSRAALETLAIIAYKQPILRQEVERLRGVDAGGILRTLLEKNLIRILGRERIPGRPLIYGTTKKFLEVFDLKDLESLPNLKEIKAFGAEVEGTAAILQEQREAEVSGEENDTSGETQPEVEAGRTPPYSPEGS
jgi:segregation and condensation protein B